MQAWTMTPKQYEAAIADEFLSENRDFPRAEYNECYPAGSRNAEWLDAVFTAIKAGHNIPAIVIDRMCEVSSIGELVFSRTFRGVNEEQAPEGYIPPSMRRKIADELKAHKSKLTQIRRGVRA